MSERCCHCEAEATLLCDGIVGWRRDRWEPEAGPGRWFNRHATGYWVIRGGLYDCGESMVTCDRALCRDCAHHAGTTFACGKAGWIDTTDYCRDCAAVSRATAPLLEDEELDALRARRQLRRTP